MKHYRIIFIFLIIAFGCDTASTVKAPGKNYFVKYFGGDGNQHAVGLITNKDGSFFILGNSRIATDSLQKIYLAKANAEGNLLWQITYGDAEMTAVDFLIDNNSIVVVANKSIGIDTQDKQIQLVKFDLNGNVGINAVLGYPSAKVSANSITLLSDGDFVISGNTDYVEPGHVHSQNALHFRTDNNFVKRTTSWLDIDGSGEVNNIVNAFQPSGDTIYFFGSTNASPSGYTDQNFWTFGLLSSSGAPYGNSDDNSEFVEGPNLSDEFVTNVKKAPVGYVMSGVSIEKSTQNQSLEIIKISNNDLVFNSSDIHLRYSGRPLGKGANPFTTSCIALSGYLILANSYNIGANSDMMLIKLYPDFANKALKELWHEPIMLGGDGDDTAAAVAELPTGHIMVLGTMNMGKPAEQYKIVLMKLNSNGRLTD
jgi:hypothetical protein